MMLLPMQKKSYAEPYGEKKISSPKRFPIPSPVRKNNRPSLTRLESPRDTLMYQRQTAQMGSTVTLSVIEMSKKQRDINS